MPHFITKSCRKKSALQLLRTDCFHVSSLNLLLYSFLVVDNWMGKEISQKTEEKEESTVLGKNRFSTNICWMNEKEPWKFKNSHDVRSQLLGWNSIKNIQTIVSMSMIFVMRKACVSLFLNKILEKEKGWKKDECQENLNEVNRK